jgi:hypothetical protein
MLFPGQGSYCTKFTDGFRCVACSFSISFFSSPLKFRPANIPQIRATEEDRENGPTHEGKFPLKGARDNKSYEEGSCDDKKHSKRASHQVGQAGSFRRDK